ncbi:MAG TPA: helix-turn-helix transcriptional regulator [Streptosporangiaceae bacterium]|nr:helix-turn-helix transcriptional regulator [Streptosporangiaceae bacterium]
MAGQAGPGFGGLLRRLRNDAGLTQDELAEAAQVSQRAVSDLERGINRTARKDTALLLAGALGLDGQARDLFVAAARGRGTVEAVLAARPGTPPGAFAAAATRALPRDIAAFTGREAELARLMAALDGPSASGGVVGIHAIDGMAGIGKTSFAVHAAHRLSARFPDGQFFLPLHAHTAGQRPVDPADGLASLLLAAGLAAAQIPPGLEARAARWRAHVADRKILLVLDDAAGHDQVRPLLPGAAGSLVLVTSRRRLIALEDSAVISLDILAPGQAAALLTRLTARAGIDAADHAVSEITRLCGYLPLAIGLMAGQLKHHPARTAGQLAGDLAAATDRMALLQAENLSVTAAFDLSYQDLTEDLQRLFRRLGLIPGPSFDAYVTAALDGAGLAASRSSLDQLYDQHLITETAPGQYRLHDLLREHARTLAATDDQADRDAAAERVLDYYLHTALAAGRYFDTWASTFRQPPPGNPPALAPDLSTLGQSVAWLEAERANLHAVADYAATRGRSRHAIAIPAAMGSFLAARGHWDQSAVLHQSALATARQVGDRLGEADTLSTLGALQRETGHYPAAAASLARALALYVDAGDRPGQANVLNQLGFLQVLTGDYPAATASHEQALALARSARDRLAEGAALNHLALVQQLTGDHPAATASQQQALTLFTDLGDLHGQAYALNDLGVIQQETGHYPAAAASQQQALALFRDIGHRLGQAHALNDLGLVQQQTGEYPAAAASHQQALALFRDLGNPLGQAEALNRLGELSLRTSATGQARDRHTRALAIARDISAAPEEARALEGIGNSHLRDGNLTQAAEHLQQALTIYQRIGAPAAGRVEETLRRHQMAPQPGS